MGERHDRFEKTHAEHQWWNWYAPHLSARQSGSNPEVAAAIATWRKSFTFFPDDAVRVAALTESVGRWVAVEVNSSKRKSLRSTIPMSVVKNTGPKAGDNLRWKYEIRNCEIVTTLTKVNVI
jgi:hypothetical protein